MRTRFGILTVLLLGCFLLAGGSAFGEVLVKEKRHVDSFYANGQVRPEITLEIQWWYGKNKVIYEGQALRLILDTGKKQLTVINKQAKTYTELTLPVKPADHIDPKMPTQLVNYKVNGSFKDTGKKVKVNEKECRVFTGSDELKYLVNVFYGREREIMITSDVPFDWKLRDQLFEHIRSIFNPQQSLLDDLKKINGYVYASENKFMFRGMTIKSQSTTLEIATKPLPENLSGIPKDFKKKERLTFPELRQIRGIIYW